MPILIEHGWERVPFLFNGFCYFVPSNKLLEELIGDADIESQKLFQKHSNEIVKNMAHAASLRLLWSEVEQRLCVCLGDSWDAFQRHVAIVDYCKGVMPQGIYGSQKGIDAACATLSVFHQALNLRVITRIPSAFPVKLDRDGDPLEHPATSALCLRSAEFRNSSNYIKSFYGRVIDQLDNPKISKLCLEYVEAYKRLALDNRGLPAVTGQTLLRKCLYCGKHFEMLRGPSGKLKPHCGAVQCQRQYDRLKPSRTSKRATPIGWVRAFSRKPCKGACGRERVDLNSDWLCRRCFSEPLT